MFHACLGTCAYVACLSHRRPAVARLPTPPTTRTACAAQRVAGCGRRERRGKSASSLHCQSPHCQIPPLPLCFSCHIPRASLAKSPVSLCSRRSRRVRLVRRQYVYRPTERKQKVWEMGSVRWEGHMAMCLSHTMVTCVGTLRCNARCAFFPHTPVRVYRSGFTQGTHGVSGVGFWG